MSRNKREGRYAGRHLSRHKRFRNFVDSPATSFTAMLQALIRMNRKADTVYVYLTGKGLKYEL